MAVDLRNAVNQALNVDYFGDINEIVKEVVPKVAKDAAKKLKSESPKGKTGKYAKGWSVQVENGRIKTEASVYGKTGTYQLAHLLEFGHVTRNGTGRTFGRTGARVHIAPVEEWASQELETRLIQRIKQA